jgi:hypothetical protein
MRWYATTALIADRGGARRLKAYTVMAAAFV